MSERKLRCQIMKSALLLIGIFASFLCSAQETTVSPMIGFARLFNKVPPISSSQLSYRQIQFATIASVEIERTILPRIGLGLAASYNYISFNRVFSIGTGKKPIEVWDFPSAVLFGKYYFCAQCGHKLYTYGSINYALGYPSKMNISELETSSKVISGAGVGLRSKSKRRLVYQFELGYWNSGVLARGGFVYRLNKTSKQK